VDAAVTVDAPIDACAAMDTCGTASMLGAVSGDTGHQTLTASGSTSTWLRVRVTEDDLVDVNGVPLQITVSLTVPAGTDFDVDIYVNPDNDVVECVNTFGTHSTSGDVKTVHANWGETDFTNLDDDSRDVSIAIRSKGACSPD